MYGVSNACKRCLEQLFLLRSDLERDSAHSSLEQRAHQQQEIDLEYKPPPSASGMMTDKFGRRMSHEQRYEELQRLGNLRASMELQKKLGSNTTRYPILDTNQIQMRFDHKIWLDV